MPDSYMSTPSWREIHGSNNWENMLDPDLDISLRRSILSYGEHAQATYDAFIAEPESKSVGGCHFSPEDLLMKCDVASASMYEVTKLIYATSKTILPWTHKSNWIGYVAVATDEGKSTLGRRDVVITWRGTMKMIEWMDNADVLPTKASALLGNQNDKGLGQEYGDVHHGWMSLYTSDDPHSEFNKTSARNQVLEEVKRLVELHKDEEVSITITGHSLGAALSTINAFDIVANGVNTPCSSSTDPFPVTALVFASPKVGDTTFRDMFNAMQDLRLLHVRNEHDAVPTVPPNYKHVGVELTIDTMKSKYLKKPGGLSTWHNLEAYLHGVAGTHGVHGSDEFELVLPARDIALVNKSSEALKNEYCIPGSWWLVPTNNGMLKGEDGHWKMMDSE